MPLPGPHGPARLLRREVPLTAPCREGVGYTSLLLPPNQSGRVARDSQVTRRRGGREAIGATNGTCCPDGTAGAVKRQWTQERGGPCRCLTAADHKHQQLHAEYSVGRAGAAPALLSTQGAGQTPALYDGGSMFGQITEGRLVSGGPF